MGTKEEQRPRIPADQNPPVEEENQTAEELERAEQSGESERSANESASDAADVLEREAEPLQRGRTLESPFGPLPIRALIAIAAFLAVSVVVYVAAWALLGGIGLLLGLLPAAALGLLAAREVGRRLDA